MHRPIVLEANPQLSGSLVDPSTQFPVSESVGCAQISKRERTNPIQSVFLSVLEHRSELMMMRSSLVAFNAHDSAHRGSDSLPDSLQSLIEFWIRLLQMTLVVYWA